MPKLNGTGPLGKGPLTGRKKGTCKKTVKKKVSKKKKVTKKNK